MTSCDGRVLDASGSELVTGSFGYLSSLYKVVDATDGVSYALRRVERVRTNNEVVVRLACPNNPRFRFATGGANCSTRAWCSLRDCFLSNGAVFFVHDFYPSAVSLFDRFLKACFRPF